MKDELKQKIIHHYLTIGPEQFYSWLIAYARDQIEIGASPHFDLLNRSKQFFQIYRSSKEEVYRELSFIFRRASNKIYRIMLKRQLINPNRRKFFNLVG